MRTSIAIYFDLENIDKKLILKKLLEAITLNIEEDSTPVFAIKLACGNTESIAKFREQLRDLNFDIREAPHISKGNLKNRADLILTVEAFESLYQKSPEIDLYVFITSDTDFTVIMDKLRKYGKNVWLVTKESEKDKELFTSSSDKILVMEHCFKGNENTATEITQIIEKILTGLGFSKNESAGIKEIIESFEKDKWFDGGLFGTKLRNLIKDFSYKGKKVNSQNKLFDEFKKNGIMETKKEGKVDSFKIVK
ncbi:MAG: NYN domain-containing protein [Treponema sp.]